MPWDVEYADEFFAWWGGLDQQEETVVAVAVEYLAERGPTLGRPFVETLSGSRHPNMKELRPKGGHLRILFAFDPRRLAILLIGGDKTGEWSAWYRRMIPIADELDDEHLETLKSEGLLP